MAIAWHPTTKDYRATGDEIVLAAQGYVIITAPGQATKIVPETHPRYWKLSNGEIVEMTQQEKDAADHAAEPIAARHMREQQEGVTLANGWVMAYTREARDVMVDLKNLLDLTSGQLPGVSFWEVDGTRHNVSVQTGLQVLADYAVKSATEVMRQYEEVSGG